MLLGSASRLCGSVWLLMCGLGRAGTTEVEIGVAEVRVGETEPMTEAMGAMVEAMGGGRVILGERFLFECCANGGAILSRGQGTVEELEGACALYTSLELVFFEELGALSFWMRVTLEEDVVSNATDPILLLVEFVTVCALGREGIRVQLTFLANSAAA